jgi:hypothetical protein
MLRYPAQVPSHRGTCAVCLQEDVALRDGRPTTNHLGSMRHQTARAALGLSDEPEPVSLSQSERTMLRHLRDGGPTQPEGRDRETCKRLRRIGLAKHVGAGLTGITEAGLAALPKSRGVAA